MKKMVRENPMLKDALANSVKTISNPRQLKSFLNELANGNFLDLAEATTASLVD